MNIQAIIHKKAGHDIPRGYLQVALQNCPTYLGMSVQDNVDGTPLLETSAEAKKYDVDELCKTLAQLKDVPVVLQIGKMDQDFDVETDMMPYVFQMAGGEGEDPIDILSVFLEGDFPNYAKPGKGHTDEYNLWDDFLFPTVMEKFEASEDVDNFFSRLRQSSFEQAIMNTVQHRAAAVFVPLHGDIIAFGRNELGAEYDWGSTSNTFGWGSQFSAGKVTDAVVAAVKKPMGRLARALVTTAVEAPPVEKPEVKNPPGVHNVPDKTEKPVTSASTIHAEIWAKWPGTSSKTHTMVKPPAVLQGNARNSWIRLFLGLNPSDELPKGKDHKDFALPVHNELIGFAQEQSKTKEDVKRLQSRVIAFLTPSEDVGKQMAKTHNQSDPSQAVEPDPNQVQQPAKEEKPMPADWLPEVSADEKKIATDLVTDWATNPKRPSSLDVQRIESKWPRFTKSHGITLTDVVRWNMQEKKMFMKKCPNDAAMLVSELLLKIGELGGFEKEVEVDPKKAQEQVEVPSVKPMATPAKGGRLARAKGQAA